MQTREYAKAVAVIVKDLFPKSYAVFEEHTMGGVQLSATERNLLKTYLCGVAWDKTKALPEGMGRLLNRL